MLPKIIEYTVKLDTKNPEVDVTEDQIKRCLDMALQIGIDAATYEYGPEKLPVILESSIKVLETK